MLETINQMEKRGDQNALQQVWRLLGGESQLPEGTGAELVGDLIHRLCGKGDRYAAERSALADLGKTVGVDAGRYPRVDALEDDIIEALAQRLEEKLDAMTPEERHAFFEEMVRRMSDEERLRLIEQVLDGYEKMPDEEKAAFRRRLATELDIGQSQIDRALTVGGAAALIPLLLAKETGFAIYLGTTKIMYATASSVGLTIPFSVYMLKNRALGWLLGPVGMLVTTALSAGWFSARAWRRKERFRKLVQVVAYCSAWRDALPAGSGSLATEAAPGQEMHS
jgi:hypothetical protein